MVGPTVPMPEAVEPSSRRRQNTTSEMRITAGRFEIDTDRPLAMFEHPYADAFECVSTDSGVNDHIAIVIKGRYPARKDVTHVCLGNEITGLLIMRGAHVVKWPHEARERYAMIFRRPAGEALVQKYMPRRDPMPEDNLRRGVIRPIVSALESMSDRNIFHGNIRPDNIFVNSTDNVEVVLGECASMSPGINQPVIFETIERSMADPQSRGAGSTIDDIYALGVTVSILLRGTNPMEGKNTRAIIEEKIIRGSYTLLTDGLRLSPGISEFLRATLNDDPRQRWTIEQLVAWIDGTRTTPKQSPLSAKAQRALDFNGKQYMRARLLAHDLHENPSEAITLIESGHLAKWVERSLGDQPMTDMINAAISRANTAGRGTGFEERLLCYVCMALDPYAPIRYKDIKALPAGVGHAMAFALLNNGTLQNFGELISERYAWMWLNQKDHAHDVYNLLHIFDLVSKVISRRGIMHGIERCLYELCPDVPCMSDYFKDFYIADCGLLLEALDEVAERHKDQKPIDRHIASYITTADRHDNSGLFILLEGNDPLKRSLALLTLYQQLQRRYNNPKLENLCGWLLKEAEAVAMRFKNIMFRAEVQRQLPKEVKSGNLSRLLSLVDNPVQVKKDDHDFVQASRLYVAYGYERDNIRHDLNTNRYYGFNTGRQYAMIIALVVAGIMIVSTFVMNFSGFGF